MVEKNKNFIFDLFIKRWISGLLFIFIFSFSANAQNEIKLANEYYSQGEKQKALKLFIKLSNDRNNIDKIHFNFLNLIITEKNAKEGAKYFTKLLKYFPDDINYECDYIFFLTKFQYTDDKIKNIQNLKEKYKNQTYILSMIGENFVRLGLTEDALDFFLTARVNNGNNIFVYNLELANIYRLLNKLDLMVEEYLNYALIHRNNMDYFQNLIKIFLTEEKEKEIFMSALFNRIQLQPNEIIYPKLLIWLELQSKNFYSAFIQSRAVDKRENTQGNETLRIAIIAFNNDYWEDAIKILDYLIKEYPKGMNYAISRNLKIKSLENLYKNEIPVDTSRIRELITEYKNLYLELGNTAESLDGLRRKALLHAFYFDEKDSAIVLLTNILKNNNLNNELKSQCKIDLGDIYLLNDEPWESSLLYSQVEKSNKYSTIGYNAKYKNAKLYYYTGNFALAKSHLDVLKNATTKEISNDAIDISLLIRNNTVFDSTDQVLKEFANVELMLFQNKDSIAKKKLLLLIEKNPYHSIVDESYWLLSNIEMKKGNFEKSIEYLDKIITMPYQDILTDDAFFLKGKIYQDYLKDYEKAKTIYNDFLVNHQGSIYTDQVRKRFRALRDNNIN